MQTRFNLLTKTTLKVDSQSIITALKGVDRQKTKEVKRPLFNYKTNRSTQNK